ncbi:hypothetical protein [Sulfuriroseicoccus oceanibius]|uniref:Uncharacterized protein n=1 Tax=Sulfuriroseicoccus oceanibius TaxID=2707525 RepID=A0A6B3LDN1_9BACT|nr:hypothetical protein [Sulfuriroseicoccus oceanibius]QQL45125.1 hypothetical protein G3M56_000620 [Sulfuriroseicoccus oceanibius]
MREEPMVDHFKALGVSRSLWLAPEDVRTRFQSLSRERHPDAEGGGDGYAAVVDAAAVLQDPAKRLPHWLALHGVEYDARSTPPSAWVADEFSRVAALVHAANEAVAKRDAATSALGQAVANRAVVEANDQIVEMLDQLRQRGQALDVELQAMEEAGEADVDVVSRCAVDYGFLGKWIGQLRTAMASLV